MVEAEIFNNKCGVEVSTIGVNLSTCQGAVPADFWIWNSDVSKSPRISGVKFFAPSIAKCKTLSYTFLVKTKWGAYGKHTNRNNETATRSDGSRRRIRKARDE